MIAYFLIPSMTKNKEIKNIIDPQDLSDVQD